VPKPLCLGRVSTVCKVVVRRENDENEMDC
jgi:hypothetical protein